MDEGEAWQVGIARDAGDRRQLIDRDRVDDEGRAAVRRRDPVGERCPEVGGVVVDRRVQCEIDQRLVDGDGSGRDRAQHAAAASDSGKADLAGHGVEEARDLASAKVELIGE